jgi:hypothetical protein
VALRRVWWRTSRRGAGRTRLSIERLAIPRPGTYELRITGLAPDADYADCAVVFVRPIGAALAVTIPALVAAVGLTAAGVAVSSVLLFGTSRDDATIPPHPSSSPAPTPRPAPAAAADVHGGRAVASDPARLAGAIDVVWPLLEMHVRVPPDWVVRKLGTTDLDLRHPTRPSTFVVAHATPVPAGPGFDDYVRADVEHARARLATHEIDGFATKRIGPVPGVATLTHQGEGGPWLLTWTGYQPAAVGSVSVTVALGASTDDFADDEALLGAILDGIRFD